MGKLTFRTKLMFALLATATASIAIVGGMSYYTGNSALETSAYDRLRSVREIKKRGIESYFGTIRNQVITHSHDLMVVEAMREFKRVFYSASVGVPQERLSAMRDSLRTYYSREFLPRLNANLATPATVDPYMVDDPNVTTLQYAYIANNPNETGNKHLQSRSELSLQYDDVHARFHPIFKQYLEAFGYYDIFLVDPATGNIIYTVFKEIDFSTSLKNGPYANTNIGRAFKMALGSDNRNKAHLIDFEPYDPSYSAPASFISSPIYDGDSLIGVLIYQIPINTINSIMTGDNRWQQEGLGATGETYIVGEDFKMRSNTRYLISEPDRFFDLMRQNGMEERTLERIRSLNTTILNQKVETKATLEALTGLTGEELVEDYRGIEVLCAFAPLNIEGVKWVIVSEIDEAEAFAANSKLLYRISAVSLIIILIVVLLAYIIANSIALPIQAVQKYIEDLAQGKLPRRELEVRSRDEIGSMITSVNSMVDRFRAQAHFAQEIGQGNLSAKFEALNEEDVLGNALLQMRANLVEVANQDAAREWLNEGVRLVNEELRSVDELNVVLERTMNQLATYVGAAQAGIYLLEKDAKKGTYLRLLAHLGFSADRLRNPDQNIEEGLVGRVVKSHQMLHLRDVPQAYFRVSSAAGDIEPGELIIAPLLVNENLIGVIELTALSRLSDQAGPLVQRVSNAIASAVFVFQTNEQTKQLLIEAKKLNESLVAQEEELRQNSEELAATNEEMQRRAQELERAKEDLEAKNELMRRAQRELEEKNEEMLRTQQELEEKNEAMLAAQADLRNAMAQLKENEASLERQVDERTKELQSAMQEAERANRVKSSFLANMSHELRTPLNGILGYAQIMLDANDLPRHHKDKISIINKSGEHLLGLINEVLDLSKIEAGKMDLHMKEFQLTGFLREIYDLFKLRANEKGLNLEFEVDPSLPASLTGDEGKLRQCIINLMGNAVKFTANGGVRLEAKRENADTMRFAVVDTGRGIPADKLDAILKPFEQVYDQANTEGGTGLGLAITKSYIELMGGKLYLESQVGKGSTFSFTLPLQGAAQQTTLEEMARAQEVATAATHSPNGNPTPTLPSTNGKPAGEPAKVKIDIAAQSAAAETRKKIVGVAGSRKYKILIVDDNKINRDVASEILTEIGFILDTAENGKVGVEKFNSFRPDLILMDIKMPIMDGVEATQTIRKMEGGDTSKVKIMALTASVFEQERQSFIDRGCDAYLGKPYKVNQLLDAISKLMGIEYTYEESKAPTAPLSGMDLKDDDYQHIAKVLGPQVVEQIEENFDYGDYAAVEDSMKGLPTDDPRLVKFAEIVTTQINNMQYDQIDQVVRKLRNALDRVA